MTEPVLLVDVADRVALLTMNRPEARNALNRALRAALVDTVGALQDDPSVDVMVITGADPAFSAGIDLKELGGGQDDGQRLTPSGRTATRGPFPPRRKLLIGAVNGAAVTGGLEIALNCDFLVASEMARFADTHARVGIFIMERCRRQARRTSPAGQSFSLTGEPLPPHPQLPRRQPDHPGGDPSPAGAEPV